MFMDQKNQYCENEQSIDSMQSLSSYQRYFQRTGTNNFTICMEIEKTSNSQSNLERRMELEESACLTSDYTTKLQSSKQYGAGTKTEI